MADLQPLGLFPHNAMLSKFPLLPLPPCIILTGIILQAARQAGGTPGGGAFALKVQ